MRAGGRGEGERSIEILAGVGSGGKGLRVRRNCRRGHRGQVCIQYMDSKTQACGLRRWTRDIALPSGPREGVTAEQMKTALLRCDKSMQIQDALEQARDTGRRVFRVVGRVRE